MLCTNWFFRVISFDSSTASVNVAYAKAVKKKKHTVRTVASRDYDHSSDHLSKLSLALRFYHSDWDETYPNLNSFERTKKALKPYLSSRPCTYMEVIEKPWPGKVVFHQGKHGVDGYFISPTTNKPYLFNSNLSYQKVHQVKDAENTFFASEPLFAPNGKLGVKFASGSFEWFNKQSATRFFNIPINKTTLANRPAGVPYLKTNTVVNKDKNKQDLSTLPKWLRALRLATMFYGKTTRELVSVLGNPKDASPERYEYDYTVEDVSESGITHTNLRRLYVNLDDNKRVGDINITANHIDLSISELWLDMGGHPNGPSIVYASKFDMNRLASENRSEYSIPQGNYRVILEGKLTNGLSVRISNVYSSVAPAVASRKVNTDTNRMELSAFRRNSAFLWQECRLGFSKDRPDRGSPTITISKKLRDNDLAQTEVKVALY